MRGLAHDRGLFVPDSFPTVSMEEVESWRSLSYADMAIEVISKFVGEDQVPRKNLEDIIKRSCAAFRAEDVTPVIEVGGHAVLVRDGKKLNMKNYSRMLSNDECIHSHHTISLSFLMSSLSLGTFPWTNICLQRCCTSNAWKFFRILPCNWFQ